MSVRNLLERNLHKTVLRLDCNGRDKLFLLVRIPTADARYEDCQDEHCKKSRSPALAPNRAGEQLAVLRGICPSGTLGTRLQKERDRHENRHKVYRIDDLVLIVDERCHERDEAFRTKHLPRHHNRHDKYDLLHGSRRHLHGKDENKTSVVECCSRMVRQIP